MMVVFVSRSEKRAIPVARRVLDSFADRIGDDTWRTVITEEGLAAVKLLLRKNATRSMAVACHWIRSRSRSDLLWIVGNRERFNEEGIVPVHTTKKNLRHEEWENDWIHLPLVKALAGMAGILHDWGKGNDFFQKKLHSKTLVPDPFRHEWISCRMLAALVTLSTVAADDMGWLSLLADGQWDSKKLMKMMDGQPDKPLDGLPPIAGMLCWLILSHHRLPVLGNNGRVGYSDTEKSSFEAVTAHLTAAWGYTNQTPEMAGKLLFSKGLLEDSKPWMEKVKKCAARLLAEKDRLLAVHGKSCLRSVLSYARLSLMLGDYYVSSQAAEKNWSGQTELYANTCNGELKQKLDEHLVRVSDQALRIARQLPRFADRMESAHDVRSLRKKSPQQFSWQDKATASIREFRQTKRIQATDAAGWFIVNMASTGCGKTFANAKIMQAISDDGKSLRYVLALGLRSLTLQTGDEYRSRIGLNRDELAVLIGSEAVRKLHALDQKEREKQERCDTDAYEELLPSALDYEDTRIDSCLDIFLDGRQDRGAAKNRAFLYKPVVAATIDHMMPAVEAIRGGRYMLPFLRLMSSDLVIDEVDDFDKTDLMAISRLVHLAGMLGRSVAISSATIPPDLAEGLFCAYQAGRSCYREFFQKDSKIACVWCDEFHTTAAVIPEKDLQHACDAYRKHHNDFVLRRVKKLEQQIVLRKGFLVDCTDIQAEKNKKLREAAYFSKIKETAVSSHRQHSFIDAVSGKKISFGLLRMANIEPCVKLCRFLLETDWPDGVVPEIMVYHSRQLLLLRHVQEAYLDCVLKRKGEKEGRVVIKEPLLRKHIDAAEGENVIFIIAATPVEEIGRDHDFDWAIVEPSSYRSFIQLAGRILRHRNWGKNVAAPNIAIMQYNLKGMDATNKWAFRWPGYETSDFYSLGSHDMRKLVDEKELEKGINAIPRIQKPANPVVSDGLIALEHVVMQDFKDIAKHGPGTMLGWLQEYWWLTGLPQKVNPFRESMPQLNLYRIYEEGSLKFCTKSDNGELVTVGAQKHLQDFVLSETAMKRLWLCRDYEKALREHLMKQGGEIEEREEDEELKKLSATMGEISIPIDDSGDVAYWYSDQLGLFKKED